MNHKQSAGTARSPCQALAQASTRGGFIATVLPTIKLARWSSITDSDTNPSNHGPTSRERTPLPRFLQLDTAEGTSNAAMASTVSDGWAAHPPDTAAEMLLQASAAVANRAAPLEVRGETNGMIAVLTASDSDRDGKRVSRTDSSPKTAPKANSSKAKPRRNPLKTARRREQCRTSQARYREKQRLAIVELESDVQRLREEVAMLQIRRRVHLDRTYTSQGGWGLIVAYFRLFRHGLEIPITQLAVDHRDIDDALIHSSTALRSKEAHTQLQFLHSSMSSDILHGDLQGVTSWIEQARRYRVCFGDPDLRLQRLDKASDNAMVAHATACFTVTEDALHHVFPHLIEANGAREVGGAGSLLVTRLVGADFECRSSLRFELDESTGRIVRMESMLDWVGVVRRRLGNLDDTAEVLSRARISPGNSIGELESLQASAISTA